MSGWIKLHRSLLEWEWWDDDNAVRLLIYLLVAVNHEPKKWQGMTIESGQLFTSWDKLAEKTGLTVKQIRVATKKLEDSNELVRKGQAKGQLLTLVKWEKLQGEGSEEGRQRAGKGQAKGRQRAATKEYKNIRNEEYISNNPSDILDSGENEKKTKKTIDFLKLLIEEGVNAEVAADWLEVRKKKGGVNTGTAWRDIASELQKARSALIPPTEAITMAVTKAWRGYKWSWHQNELNKLNENGTGQAYAPNQAYQISKPTITQIREQQHENWKRRLDAAIENPSNNDFTDGFTLE